VHLILLIHRWGVLRRPLSLSIGLGKTTALVMCLCRLHNFCIQSRLGYVDNVGRGVPLTPGDEAYIASVSGIAWDDITGKPAQLLDGGNHLPRGERALRCRNTERHEIYSTEDGLLLRDLLHQQVFENDLSRPRPPAWK
jgi:hypothetical protein